MKNISYAERVAVYNDAIKRYGRGSQCIVALEELSECQKEICKFLRGKGNLEHLAEEVADATIMLEQVRLMFDLDACVCQVMDEKVQRLSDRLNADSTNISGQTTAALERMGAQAHGGAEDV